MDIAAWKKTAPESFKPYERRVAGTGDSANAGFSSVRPTAPWPKLAEVLESAKWTPVPIRVGRQPGTSFQYSGGGYCLMELLLEDVAGKPFPTIARELVFEPLQMTHSWFEQRFPPERERVVAVDGKPQPQLWKSYPPTSAAGLWTTPSDLARLVIELQSAFAGEESKALSPALAREILTIQGREDSYPDGWRLAWGLGVGSIGWPPVRFFHIGSNPGYQCEVQAYIHGGRIVFGFAMHAKAWPYA